MPTTTRGGRSRRDASKAGKSNGAAAASARTGRKAAPPRVGPGSIVNHAAALKWLNSHVNYERMRVVPYNNRTFSLERMRRLLDTLDNPHRELKCVQVAGTKGKGSACAMLARILQSCGYTVGLYTSPHLIDLCERITIDGEMITPAALTDLLKLIAYRERALGENKPSYFEVLTAAALRYFADQAVDVVVLETGLGGRLDATSVVAPLVTGMVHISLDHTNVLGDNLRSIAREKAGIFKKGVPAVSVAQDAEVAKVLDEVAGESGAELEYTGREIEFSYRFEASRELGPHSRVCVATPTSRWDHLAVPLRGEHQAHNCCLALAILDKLKGYGFNIPEDRVVEGLAATRLPGRMEQVWDRPRVLIDGAHNACSIGALIRSLGAHIAYDSLVVIFGAGQDKDIAGMLRQLSLGADKVIFTRARANPRAAEPEELMGSFAEVSGKMAQVAATLEEALQLAGRAVSREDLIVVTGSFYLAGEAKKHFQDRAAAPRR